MREREVPNYQTMGAVVERERESEHHGLLASGSRAVLVRM